MDGEAAALLEAGVQKIGFCAGAVAGSAPCRTIVDTLARYVNEIETFNGAYGLVGCAGARELVVKHVLDSLAAAPILAGLHTGAASVADAGSGAGLGAGCGIFGSVGCSCTAAGGISTRVTGGGMCAGFGLLSSFSPSKMRLQAATSFIRCSGAVFRQRLISVRQGSGMELMRSGSVPPLIWRKSSSLPDSPVAACSPVVKGKAPVKV